MSKHVVFVLHGMGQQKDDWSKEGIDALKKGSRAIGYPVSLATDFEFIEINYGHLFSEYISQFNKNASDISTFMSANEIGTRSSFFQGIFSFAAGPLSEKKFVVGALGDVFLYRLSEYKELVRNFVLKEMLGKLEERENPEYWSAIGHSLGTRVLHDAMDDFLSNKEFVKTFGKPQCLAMISNVTHLLAYSPSTLWKKTQVFPRSTTLTTGGCYRYVNANHPADPFTWVREFDPTTDWGNDAEHSGDYHDVDISLKDLNRVNTHSFTGYLENPKVAAAICWGLGDGGTGLPEYDINKLMKANSSYAKATLEGNVVKVRDKADELKKSRDLSEFREFVQALHDFDKFIRKFGEGINA